LYSFWKFQKSVFLVRVNDWFQEDMWIHPSLHVSFLDIQTSNEIQVLRLLHRCSWGFCSFRYVVCHLVTVFQCFRTMQCPYFQGSECNLHFIPWKMNMSIKSCKIYMWIFVEEDSAIQ
jgi:hypothetical protein